MVTGGITMTQLNTAEAKASWGQVLKYHIFH